MSFHFPRTLGLSAAKSAIANAWESRRFPHALLLHGAPGVGQNALALDTAQLILCESRHEKPCDHCAACIGFKAQSLENLFYLFPLRKANKDSDAESLDAAGMDEYIERQQAWHHDPYLFTWPEKSSIQILQVRDLQKQLLYAESRGRARVILLPWLESLRPEAANALLKTLEEPPKDTYFVITSEDRAGLMPTLLSRCQHIALAPLSDAELAESLKQWTQRLPKGPSASLIPLAEGAPGGYLKLHETGEQDLEVVARFLAAGLELEIGTFIEFVETSETFADLEKSAHVFEMALRLVRLEQKRRVYPDALAHADAQLQAALAPLRRVEHLPTFTAYLEEGLKAVRDYVKPQNAVIGLFLDYEAKVAEIGKAA
jgi:DNA polymerase III subunit delta'